jgi:hypothetical protein
MIRLRTIVAPSSSQSCSTIAGTPPLRIKCCPPIVLIGYASFAVIANIFKWCGPCLSVLPTFKDSSGKDDLRALFLLTGVQGNYHSLVLEPPECWSTGAPDQFCWCTCQKVCRYHPHVPVPGTAQSLRHNHGQVHVPCVCTHHSVSTRQLMHANSLSVSSQKPMTLAS